MNFVTKLLFVLSVFGCVSCVTPPETISPRVIPNDEIQLVSAVKRGTDYAASGRMDLAEQFFREALKKKQDLPAVYNDLGYVLMAQSRDDEAEQMFRRSLELAPESLRARDNLARIFYRKGEFEEALEQYQLLLNSYYGIWGGTLEGIPSVEFTAKDLVSVYRNTALVYVSLGKIDEAICSSGLAVSLNDGSYDLASHARFLLGLERTDLALQSLRDLVSLRQGDVGPDILIDYGMTLYVGQNYELSREALTRIAAIPGVDQSTRQDARVLRLLISSKLGDAKETESIGEALLEDEGDVCENPRFPGYWPVELQSEMSARIEELCHGVET